MNSLLDKSCASSTFFWFKNAGDEHRSSCSSLGIPNLSNKWVSVRVRGVFGRRIPKWPLLRPMRKLSHGLGLLVCNIMPAILDDFNLDVCTPTIL